MRNYCSNDIDVVSVGRKVCVLRDKVGSLWYLSNFNGLLNLTVWLTGFFFFLVANNRNVSDSESTRSTRTVWITINMRVGRPIIMQSMIKTILIITVPVGLLAKKGTIQIYAGRKSLAFLLLLCWRNLSLYCKKKQQQENKEKATKKRQIKGRLKAD